MADSFKQQRFRWLDRVMRDGTLTPSTRLVAWEIARHLNSVSGDAWPSQATMQANQGFKDISTVKRAVKALRAAGYITVTLDLTTKSNTYSPNFSASDGGTSATLQGGKFRDRRWQKPGAQGGTSAPQYNLRELNQVTEAAPHDWKSSRDAFRKARAELSAVAASIDEQSTGQPLGNTGWPSVKRRLANRFGPDIAASWFEKLSHESSTDSEITLTAPTKFILDYISANYGSAIEQAWQAAHPAAALTRVRLVLRQQRAAE